MESTTCQRDAGSEEEVFPSEEERADHQVCSLCRIIMYVRMCFQL